MTTLVLTGCRPEPLASYLKALGVFRLVSQQVDKNARGWWEGDCFHLESSLDAHELQRFLVEDFRPTPIVAPWNGGSGFYEGDDVSGRNALLHSTHPRFAAYRDTLERILSWKEMPTAGLTLGQLMVRVGEEGAKMRGKKAEAVAELLGDADRELQPYPQLRQELLDTQPEQLVAVLTSAGFPNGGPLAKAAKKIRTKANELTRAGGKEALVEICRTRLGDEAVEWLDAVVLVGAEGQPNYPPLLGTGGNDGRLDYTNTQMLELSALLLPEPRTNALQLLDSALFGTSTSGLGSGNVGQFDPGRAGGFNQGLGIKGATPNNPWDYVLSLEGAPVWACNIVRRQAGGSTSLSAPFTVAGRSVGYGSASSVEQARAEIWAPLWTQKVALPELRAFFGEGRAEVGRKRARDGLQFAEAIGSVSVARGVSEFVRYSMLERRGKMYVSLPAGRFLVQHRAEADFARELQGSLVPLDTWLRITYPNGPPAGLGSARNNIDRALFEMLARGGSHSCIEVFRALGRFAGELAGRSPSKLPGRPPQGLGARWVRELLDPHGQESRTELRLAVGLASTYGTRNTGPLRTAWLPVDPARPYAWTANGGRETWHGTSLEAKMSSTLARRLQLALKADEGTRFLGASMPCHAEDVMAFLNRDTDDLLLEELTRGLSWIAWGRESERGALSELYGHWRHKLNRNVLPGDWCLLRLSLGGKRKEAIEIKPAPAIISLLESGSVGEACALARQRLLIAGLIPHPVSFPDGDLERSQRMAGSLLFPLRTLTPLMERIIEEKESN